MTYRVSVLAVLAILGSAGVARAQAAPDEASLKLAHETVIKAVTSANLTVLQAMIHPRASGFFRSSQQPVLLGSGVTAADILPTLMTDLGTFAAITTTSTGYRAVGPIGVVTVTVFQKRKSSEKGPDLYVRGTYVYGWDEGSWKLVSWHGSDTPVKK